MAAGQKSDAAGTGGGRALSPVLENYLEIIFRLETSEGAARASSIAEAAGVSRSTVTSALKALKSMGYVEYEPYTLIHLTREGLEIGRDIAHRHIVFQEFFQNVLQLEPNQADAVACELEHVVPAEVVRRIGQFVLYLKHHKDQWEHWQEEYVELGLDKQHQGAFRPQEDETRPALALRGALDHSDVAGKYR